MNVMRSDLVLNVLPLPVAWGVAGFVLGGLLVFLALCPALRRGRHWREQALKLDKDLATLQVQSEERQRRFQDALDEARDQQATAAQLRQQMTLEFQQLAGRILEEKGQSLSQHSRQSLDSLLTPFREQIDGFQKRVNEVHSEAVRGNATLSVEIRKVLEAGMSIGAQATALAAALKGDKKTTGNWGEMQLENALQAAGLLRDEHYVAQPHFRDEKGNRRHPDFVVKLPDSRHIVIDSKVSLVDYERAVSAQSGQEAESALLDHVKAVRRHIDDLSSKDYSNLPGVNSPGLVLMFMPIEPAYIEALRQDRGIFDYGYQRNVVLVSPTTLMPVLKTVSNVWMLARTTEQAHEVGERAGDIYNQVVVVAERLKKLGDLLDGVSRQYNQTVTAVAGQQGLYGKVSRFNEFSTRARKDLPPLAPTHPDFENEKLELIVIDRTDKQERSPQ
jgi:DNA recombination protein RmuC